MKLVIDNYEVSISAKKLSDNFKRGTKSETMSFLFDLEMAFYNATERWKNLEADKRNGYSGKVSAKYERLANQIHDELEKNNFYK